MPCILPWRSSPQENLASLEKFHGISWDIHRESLYYIKRKNCQKLHGNRESIGSDNGIIVAAPCYTVYLTYLKDLKSIQKGMPTARDPKGPTGYQCEGITQCWESVFGPCGYCNMVLLVFCRFGSANCSPLLLDVTRTTPRVSLDTLKNRTSCRNATGLHHGYPCLCISGVFSVCN